MARIERLEGQCKQLVKQVTKASSRGDELNKRIDDVHSRNTRDSPSTTTNQTDSIEPQPPTSVVELTSPKLDEECLSATEQASISRRDERLKRLEAESEAYMSQVKSTNQLATNVDNKLEFLHGRFGNGTVQVVEVNAGPSTSTSNEEYQKTDKSLKTDEECLSATEREYLARRDDRLKRLEAESQAFTKRVKSRNQHANDAHAQFQSLRERDGSETEANAADSTNTSETIREDVPNHENETNQPTDTSETSDTNSQNTD